MAGTCDYCGDASTNLSCQTCIRMCDVESVAAKAIAIKNEALIMALEWIHAVSETGMATSGTNTKDKIRAALALQLKQEG